MRIPLATFVKYLVLFYLKLHASRPPTTAVAKFDLLLVYCPMKFNEDASNCIITFNQLSSSTSPNPSTTEAKIAKLIHCIELVLYDYRQFWP